MFKTISSIFAKRSFLNTGKSVLEENVKAEVSNSLKPFADLHQGIRVDSANIRIKLDEIQIALDKSFAEMQQKFVQFDKKLTDKFTRLEAKLDKNHAESMKLFEKLYNILSEDSTGMETGLERLCGKWLERLLLELKTTHTPIIYEHKLFDTYGIVHGCVNAQVEVDVFIDSPRIIVECVNFLEEDDLIKVQKFSKTKDLAASQASDGQCRAYFVVYSIHPDIRSDALTILNDNGIVLIEVNDDLAPKQ